MVRVIWKTLIKHPKTPSNVLWVRCCLVVLQCMSRYFIKQHGYSISVSASQSWYSDPHRWLLHFLYPTMLQVWNQTHTSSCQYHCCLSLQLWAFWLPGWFKGNSMRWMRQWWSCPDQKMVAGHWSQWFQFLSLLHLTDKSVKVVLSPIDPFGHGIPPQNWHAQLHNNLLSKQFAYVCHWYWCRWHS